MEKHDNLLKEFGSHFGLELAFDEMRQCFLTFDDVLVSVREVEGRFVLHGMLGEFPGNVPASFWQHLLELSSTLTTAGRGAITFDTQTDAVILMQSIDVQYTTAVDLANHFSEFVEQIEHLVVLLTSETAELAEQTEQAPADNGENSGGAMSISFA